MKSLWRVTLSVLTLLVLGIFAWQAPTSDVLAQDEPLPTSDVGRSVRVSGMAEIEVVPDVAHLRLGVETRDQEASTALAQNSERMQSLIDSLLEAGIPREQIQTQTVRLRPQREEPPRPQPDVAQPQPAPPPESEPGIVGYVATNTVEVEVEDLDAIGSIIDRAVEAGANRIDSIRFAVSDVADVQRQVRAGAWQDALEQAEHLAELAGAQLGPVVAIEAMDQPARPLVQERAVQLDVAETPIEPGTQSFSMSLLVTWQLQ
jgi:uncharacterized protein